MTMRAQRMTRRIVRGDIILRSDVPDVACKPGSPVIVNGRPYVELVDGRVVETTYPRMLSWPYVEMHDGHMAGGRPCCKPRTW